ncbi:hypothetical protein SVI_0967 [Shewanella violacea DSS12]|uniref:Uncharacterized protein n=1 Tax=Shewanella violacea (strain JCM 10179 / CIP 106290 / LMG 19151 / DSS12) TaxID=637905 RepID=D4ZGY9_SHEVD|nr:hypothetical protein SVI_0967 [Shewanella violacea DSS12]
MGTGNIKRHYAANAMTTATHSAIELKTAIKPEQFMISDPYFVRDIE